MDVGELREPDKRRAMPRHVVVTHSSKATHCTV
jgi:hypothetical protein